MVKRLRLKIPANLIKEPIIYKMVTKFDIVPNILSARIDTDSEGEVEIELKGTPSNLEHGLEFLKKLDIDVKEL